MKARLPGGQTIVQPILDLQPAEVSRQLIKVVGREKLEGSELLYSEPPSPAQSSRPWLPYMHTNHKVGMNQVPLEGWSFRIPRSRVPLHGRTRRSDARL